MPVKSLCMRQIQYSISSVLTIAQRTAHANEQILSSDACHQVWASLGPRNDLSDSLRAHERPRQTSDALIEEQTDEEEGGVTVERLSNYVFPLRPTQSLQTI